MAKYDVTKTNDGIDRLLAVTTNPRHRFMLPAYYRHRFLEIAGRYDEIFVPEMTVEKPVYHVHASGQHTKLEGQDAVKSLYRMWADTNQAIFYVESEQVEVADNYIASTSIYHQQVSGGSLMFNKAMSYLPGFLSERIVKRVLEAKAVKPDENAMYLYTNLLEMIWPYDDLVFMGLLVIVSIDHPFTGPVHVGSEPLQTVVEDFEPKLREWLNPI